jgi:hypothetical protein
MDKHLHSLTASIVSFIEAGVPVAHVAQQQTATTLVSLSGLATFVSAVTGVVIFWFSCSISEQGVLWI